MTRLEFERRQRGLTQADLGRSILYDRAVISRLEHQQPRPEEVNRRLKDALERFFGLDFHVLLKPVFKVLDHSGKTVRAGSKALDS